MLSLGEVDNVNVLKLYSGGKRGPSTVSLTPKYYICNGDRVGIAMSNVARYATSTDYLSPDLILTVTKWILCTIHPANYSLKIKGQAL